jgi:pyruvate dehydrogenase E1 component alpha subunit
MEKEKWLARCPLRNFRARLIDERICESRLDETERRVEREIQAAVDYAMESPYPALSEAFEDVFVQQSNKLSGETREK